ncbi:MAG: UTP--glucose-1-phosphate uridylyltransferase [Paracoccaceae bacterium]
MIRTVVLPVAGQGTRMLPATKATPKELLPVYDRPVLQLALDEAVAAGAERIVVVGHPDKPAITEYLDRDPAAVAALRAKGKDALADRLDGAGAPRDVELVHAVQTERLGLGHALACAEAHVLDGPVGVILPDDVILGDPCLPAMAAIHGTGHMVAAMEVPRDRTAAYGIFAPFGEPKHRCVPVTGMVEKPAPEDAPSCLAAVGRYILDPLVFATLATTPRGAGGEVQLTDAIARDIRDVGLTAYRFTGTRFDCGTHEGLLAAANARAEAEAAAARAAGARPVRAVVAAE